MARLRQRFSAAVSGSGAQGSDAKGSDAERWGGVSVADAAVVIALATGVALGLAVVGPDGPQPRTGVVVVAAVSGLGCLVLLWARTRAQSAVIATLISVVVAGIHGYLLTPLLLAPLMYALYWLARTSDRRSTWVNGVVAVLVVGVAAIGNNLDGTLALRTLGPALWLLLPMVMGSRGRLREAWIEAVRARAEHAERTREEEARSRVTAERMRIARELHDIVAHHMTVAHAQAGTARHLLDDNPAVAAEILADLQTTTSAAILELRDTVTVLRQPGDSGDAESVQPVPGLDRLPDLVSQFGTAGLSVAVNIEGSPQLLTPTIELTCYRIVQEALTNAAKYADPRTAELVLRYEPGAVGISVRNPVGAGSLARSGGFGLIGMAERAKAVGGEFWAGPDDDGSFEVKAELRTGEAHG